MVPRMQLFLSNYQGLNIFLHLSTKELGGPVPLAFEEKDPRDANA